MSMNFSDAPPFRQLGNFVAFGVVVSFILSVTFLPALLSMLPVRVKQVDTDKKENLVADVFSSVASNYDLMNDLMSFGVSSTLEKNCGEPHRIEKRTKCAGCCWRYR